MCKIWLKYRICWSLPSEYGKFQPVCVCVYIRITYLTSGYVRNRSLFRWQHNGLIIAPSSHSKNEGKWGAIVHSLEENLSLHFLAMGSEVFFEWTGSIICKINILPSTYYIQWPHSLAATTSVFTSLMPVMNGVGLWYRPLTFDIHLLDPFVITAADMLFLVEYKAYNIMANISLVHLSETIFVRTCDCGIYHNISLGSIGRGFYRNYPHQFIADLPGLWFDVVTGLIQRLEECIWEGESCTITRLETEYIFH